MWRLLYIPCILVIAAAVIARVWFGKQVVFGKGGLPCRVDAERWSDVVGNLGHLPSSEPTAGELGRELRKAAIAQWQQRDPRAAAGREATKRFGLAVPPLAIVVMLFAVIAHRIPIPGAIALFLAATALSSLFGLLGIGAELRAVAVLVKSLRTRRAFIRSEDEDNVVTCAVAEVWLDALPPILRWI